MKIIFAAFFKVSNIREQSQQITSSFKDYIEKRVEEYYNNKNITQRRFTL